MNYPVKNQKTPVHKNTILVKKYGGKMQRIFVQILITTEKKKK